MVNIYIYIYIYIFSFYINIYILPGTICPVHCLLIALDAYMFSHNGYGNGTNGQGPRNWVPQVPAHSSLGLGAWSRTHIHYR